MRLPLRTKVWFLLAMASGLPLVASALIGLPFLRGQLEERAIQQIGLKAEAVIRDIQGQIDRAREDTLLLSRLQQVKAFLEGRGPAEKLRSELETAILVFSLSKPTYDQVRLLDANGREQARVNRSSGEPVLVPVGELQDKSDRYYVRCCQTSPDGSVYVSPLDWNVEKGQLERPLRATVRYCAAVFSSGPLSTGLAIVNVRGEYLFAALDPAGLPQATVQLCNDRGEILAERGPAGNLVVNEAALAHAREQDSLPTNFVPASGKTRAIVEAGEVTVDVPVTPNDAPTEGNKPGWCLRIRVPSAAVLAPMTNILEGGLIGLVVILLLSVTVGSWVSGQVTRPLIALTEDSRRLSAGDFNVRAVVATGDEVQELAATLQSAAREMSRQHEIEERLLRAEKLAAVGQFAAEIAHEVGNPLAAMKATLQAMQEDRTESNDPRIERVVDEIDRLAGILRGVRQTAHSRDPDPVACDATRVVSEVAAAIAAHAAQRSVSVAVNDFSDRPEARVISERSGVVSKPRSSPVLKLGLPTPDPAALVSSGCPPILADLGHLQQILFNLLINAVDATPAGGTVTVTVWARDGRVGFTVSDAGKGIRPEELERIFEPFYTTKADGSGLGLWVTCRLVRANGGTLSVDCPPGQGASFTVEFARATVEGGLV